MNPIIVTGLACGDCGKGALVDYLTRTTGATAVVRFNGGAQAGHNVVTADGRHHTFSQFGSGTLAGAKTILSEFMLIEPYAMLNEAVHLQQLGCDDIWNRLFIDERCIVITPIHQAANRLRELARGASAHGTCGQGVGEATVDASGNPSLTIRAGQLSNRVQINQRLRDLAAWKARQIAPIIDSLRDSPAAALDIATIEIPTWIPTAADAYADVFKAANICTWRGEIVPMLHDGGLIFEAAQGVLLDQDIGFHPHTTWSRTTPANGLRLLELAQVLKPVRKIGVLRCYATRHGAGPFVTENSALALNEPHNSNACWQGRFRTGVFDAVAARYAVGHAKVDEVALTHLDRLPRLPPLICTGYQSAGKRFEFQPLSFDLNERAAQSRQLFECEPIYANLPDMSPEAFVRRISLELGLPINLTSFGPTAEDWKVAG